MTKSQKISLFLLRIALGFLFLYAGFSKIIDPAWTAESYIKGAHTLTSLYAWLALPQNIIWVDFLNQWGLFLVGAALVIGLAVRSASVFGMLIMALYYIPILKFPYIGANGYIVDDHIIFILIFAVMIAFHAGSYWGLDGMIERSRKIPSTWKKCFFCK
jgi:thiosulfate dehydrogenase [quinone] large subunit